MKSVFALIAAVSFTVSASAALAAATPESAANAPVAAAPIAAPAIAPTAPAVPAKKMDATGPIATKENWTYICTYRFGKVETKKAACMKRNAEKIGKPMKPHHVKELAMGKEGKIRPERKKTDKKSPHDKKHADKKKQK